MFLLPRGRERCSRRWYQQERYGWDGWNEGPWQSSQAAGGPLYPRDTGWIDSKETSRTGVTNRLAARVSSFVHQFPAPVYVLLVPVYVLLIGFRLRFSEKHDAVAPKMSVGNRSPEGYCWHARLALGRHRPCCARLPPFTTLKRPPHSTVPDSSWFTRVVSQTVSPRQDPYAANPATRHFLCQPHSMPKRTQSDVLT